MLPNWAPMKRDARPQTLPFITFKAPSKGALSSGSPNIDPIERDIDIDIYLNCNWVYTRWQWYTITDQNYI